MIKGKNILIKTIQSKDLEELFTLLSDLESKGPFLPICMQSEIKFKNEFDSNGFICESSERYIIYSKSNEIIGLLWSFKSVPYFDAVEIGYQIFDKNNRNKGIATEAVITFTNYIFESKQVNRIEIRVATENIASNKVASKSGYIKEGTNKQAAFSKGKHYDMHIYALLRSEWSAKKHIHIDAAQVN